jgi:hypothetical protein
MKWLSELGWVCVAALVVVTALSITGCQTGFAWRAGDTERASARDDEGRDRTCRFG